MAKTLDDFLGDESGQAEAEEPSAAVEAPTGEPTPVEVEQQAEPEPPKPAEKVEDGEPPAPEDVEGLRRALQATRSERKDYKGQAARLQGELEALKAEMERARAAPPPTPPAAPVVAAAPPRQVEFPKPPSPVEDPVGYAEWVDFVALTKRANRSEAVIRQELGDQAVDAKLAVFRQAQQTDARLAEAVRLHPDPYRFAIEQATRIETERQEQEKLRAAMAEVGPDPEAFKAKIIADARAAWEAEMASQAQVQAVPRVTLPQSLGTARSAAPRGAVPSIPEDFDDILGRRKK